jgi:hypothetical protein
MSQYAWGDEVALMHFTGDSWESVWGESGQNVPIPLALVPRDSGVGRVSVGHGVMFYDSEEVAPVAENSVAGLAYTSDDVPLVAWVPRYSSALPVFAFKINRWQVGNIPGPPGTGGIDIETDADGRPVVVYSTQGSGVWCATGTDVVGIEEVAKPEAPNSRPAATVVRGLPVGGAVFDATGRGVTRTKPGVYFVRSEPSAVSGKPSAVAVRKVVLTE